MISTKKTEHIPTQPTKPNLFGLLKSYKHIIVALIILTIISNGFNLLIPRIIANAIDAYTGGHFATYSVMTLFGLTAIGIFVFTYAQNIVQTYASERVARDLRTQLTEKISQQEYAYIQTVTPATLLTNLTSDIDAVKLFVSLAIPSIISSIFLIIGASTLLLLINWKLALIVLLSIPIIGGTFFIIFGKVRQLFKKSQESIDHLNKVINESILGSALIRLLNAQRYEYDKFVAANSEAKDIGMRILGLFASLIPIITFTTNAATLIILSVGGHFVIAGSLSLGNFTAFNNYLAILIFPIIILGFMSNVIAQASASYLRVQDVLLKPQEARTGTLRASPDGDIRLQDVSVAYGEKNALTHISFTAKARTKTAIIGPTGAGKTQLLYLLTGLLNPTTGTIEYGNHTLAEYDPISLHQQIGFVFQDSIMFQLSIRENIAFSTTVKNVDLEKALATAELADFIDTLPEKLDTLVSERGTSLSGGQKQRIMLARALALNPSVLLLDDFTARVDNNTEQRILKNIQTNYPELTLISVTQKISSIEHYDQIIVLMEGELLATGTHAELMQQSPEYVQMYNSQRSTSTYELRPE